MQERELAGKGMNALKVLEQAKWKKILVPVRGTSKLHVGVDKNFNIFIYQGRAYYILSESVPELCYITCMLYISLVILYFIPEIISYSYMFLLFSVTYSPKTICLLFIIIPPLLKALLRPGFFEQVIHVDLPDHESRCAIWMGLLSGVPQEGSLSIPKLSEATEGYSGAEVNLFVIKSN